MIRSLYHLSWIGYGLATFSRHPLESGFFICMAVLAALRFMPWRRRRRRYRVPSERH